MVNRDNVDLAVVQGFGEEWSRFDQRELSDNERESLFEAYFEIFPWAQLPLSASGMDVGCGSGRWAKLVAARVGSLHCVDASADALAVAKQSLGGLKNVAFHHASVDSLPFPDASLDFGYSLGVLHHVPDTQAAITACAAKLKPGAPFLVYLYYALDNRPGWFRALWRASDVVRRAVARLPARPRYAVADLLALTLYLPLARLARWRERSGRRVEHWPLSAYRDKSFYTMRTDALDRFGTRLEQRFTRRKIAAMLEAAGFENVRFRESEPYWCAVGTKRS